MKFARYLFPVVLILPSFSADADSLTDLLPPETKVVFGIRVHNLAISSNAQAFAAHAQSAAGAWLKTVPLDGIDFLRDIDEVLIAASGKGKTPPAIAIVTGRFDLPHLAGRAKRYYHAVPLLESEAASDALVGLLDSGRIILGEPNLVRAAIDQRAGKTRIDADLNDRITSLRQRYDIWGIGDRVEGLPLPVPEGKVLESVDRFQFGMQMASGLELTAEIHVSSAEDAGELTAAFRTLAAMIKGQTSASAVKFDLQADGGNFRLDVYIPEAELKKSIEAGTAAFSPVTVAAPAAGADAEEFRPSAIAAPTPPAQPAPKPVAPKVLEQDQDTVVFKLPGKK